MSPVLLTFAAQGGRKAAFIVLTRTEDDNWDGRHESLRLLTTPAIKRHPINTKTANYLYSNQAIAGLSRPYLNRSLRKRKWSTFVVES